MQRQPVRIALVGLGEIGVRAHLPALLREPRVELAALVDSDAERRRIGSEIAPGIPVSETIDDVLADSTIDAVVLATPSWVTAVLVRPSLEAGKYVLAEKPLAPTVAAQVELRSAPGAAERLQIGLTYRHHPAIDRLRDLVSSKALGEPLYIQSSLCDERSDPVGDPDHYAKRLRALEHGPPVIFDGIHRVDQLNLILGLTPVDIHGWALTSSSDFASPNVNGAALTYGDGTIVRLEVIWLYPSLPPSQFVLTGPLGRAILEPATFELEIEVDGRRELVAPPGDKTECCFALQLERFVTACVEGVPANPGLEDALAASGLCDRIAAACLRSMTGLAAATS